MCLDFTINKFIIHIIDLTMYKSRRPSAVETFPPLYFLDVFCTIWNCTESFLKSWLVTHKKIFKLNKNLTSSMLCQRITKQNCRVVTLSEHRNSAHWLTNNRQWLTVIPIPRKLFPLIARSINITRHFTVATKLFFSET